MPFKIFIFFLFLILNLFLISSCSHNQSPENKKSEENLPSQNGVAPKERSSELSNYCIESLKRFPGTFNHHRINHICKKAEKIDPCESVNKDPIYHIDTKGKNDPAIKILVFALIHGDEAMGGTVTRAWMERLDEIDPRNSWRIIPLLNPDGMKKNMRTNANGVDLNRNFPTQNWEQEAHHYWSTSMKKNKRRYPGISASSEPETKCAIQHIVQYKPDLIIAVHTPLGILDFDGPKIDYPKGASLPWIRLGHYPGSLGRYMWKDNKTPVLTIELKGSSFIKDIGKIDKLQDLSGILAIMATKEIEKSKTARN